MSDDRGALASLRPIAAGRILRARGEGAAVGLRAGQNIVTIGSVTATVDHLALLTKRGLLGQRVIGAVQILHVAGENDGRRQYS